MKRAGCPTCRERIPQSYSSTLSSKDKTLANLLEELDFECYHEDCQVFKLSFQKSVSKERKSINAIIANLIDKPRTRYTVNCMLLFEIIVFYFGKNFLSF